MLASWTGARNLQTNKFDNNVTDSSSKNMINHDFYETNSKVTIDPAPSSHNLDVPNQGISSSSTGSGSSIFLNGLLKMNHCKFCSMGAYKKLISLLLKLIADRGRTFSLAVRLLNLAHNSSCSCVL